MRVLSWATSLRTFASAVIGQALGHLDPEAQHFVLGHNGGIPYIFSQIEVTGHMTPAKSTATVVPWPLRPNPLPEYRSQAPAAKPTRRKP
jgi:hypothetical protein